MKKIGFGSQLAGGKDTSADYLAKMLGGNWKRNAFANPVKAIFQETFEVDREFVEKWKRNSECPPGFEKNVRDCLTTIGDGFRKMKGNVWLEKAMRNQDDTIYSDLRYINETEAIRKSGGFTVLLYRPGFENTMDNDSEKQFLPFIDILKPLDFDGVIPKDLQIPFDLWIRNDGTVKDLCDKIDRIVVPFAQNFWK
jgi:hypothetical protein